MIHTRRLVGILMMGLMLMGRVSHAFADSEGDLPRLPALVGRVVDASRTRPIENARVGWRSSRKAGAIQPSFQWGATSDAEGRFEIRLDEDPDSLVVAVSDADGTGTSYREYAREDLVPSDAGLVDLGDLSLAEVNRISVLIRDSNGDPIEEARALTLEPAGGEWAEADESGLASLPARGKVSHIAAGKPGYWPVKVPVPEGLGAPLPVTLTPENRLEVTVLDRAGKPEGGVTVALETEDGSLFAIRDGSGGWIDVPDRISEFHFVERNPPRDQPFLLGPVLGSGSVEARTGPDAWVAIRRIWPGKPLVLQIRGHGVGTVLHSQPLAPMGEEETRSLVVQIDVPIEVSGIVLGPDGAPVPGASVNFEFGEVSPDRHWAIATTDESGRFSLKWFPVSRADVRIERSGYAVKIEPGVDLPRDGSHLQFVLAPPRAVLVQVVDETGKEIPGVCVGARDAETDTILAFCREHGDAAVRVQDLPQGEVLLWARVPGTQGDADVELRHDTSIPEATIVLPAQAKLIASWEMPRGRGIDAAILVLAPTDGSPPLKYELQEEGRRSDRVEVYAQPGEYDAHLEERGTRRPNPLLTERTRVTLSVARAVRVTLTPTETD